MESVSLMPFLSWISNWFYLQEGRLINKRCQSVYRRTPTSVRMRSSPLYFWWRNPSSPDVVMKALFRILEPQNRVERNTYFVFAHDFVLALRYLHFFSVANRYDRFHKIHLTLPFHGWPIIHYETCFRFAMW